MTRRSDLLALACYLALLVAVALPLSPPARASEGDAAEIGALKALIQRGRLDEARQRLAPLRAAPEPSLDVLFLSGHLNAAAGRWAEAIEDYRRMLARDPGLLRPRLELARAFYQAGLYESALYHFDLVLAEPLPDAVRANVLTFVRRIEDQTSQFTFALDFESDSLHRVRPDEVAIGGRSYRLDDVARGERGPGATFALRGRQHFGDEFHSYLRLDLRHAEYGGSRSDNGNALVTLGRVFPLVAHSLSLEAGAHHAWYQGVPLYSGVALRVADNWRIQPALQAVASLDAKYLGYVSRYDYYSGWQTLLQADLYRAFSSRTRGRVGGWAIRHDAEETPYAYWGLGLRTELSSEIPWGIQVTGRLEGFRSRYDDREPFFGVLREDTRGTFELDLARRSWRFMDLVPKLTLGYRVSDSNHPLYDYQEGYLRLGVTKEI